MRSLAYLVGRYPMLSMIFILREVVILRQMGFQIDVASINSPDHGREGLTAQEKAESDRTYYLKSHGVSGAAMAHLHAVAGHFAGYCRGLRLVFRLGGLDVKRLAFNFVYLTEALMVGVWMKRRGQRHLHAHLGSQPATVALFVNRVFGFNFSLTVHGPDEFYDEKGQYLAHKVAAAAFICCISFYCRSQLMKCSPYEHWHKLLISRLGVDPSTFAPMRPVKNSDVFEILCVGRLTTTKGQHVLLDVVARLSQQGRKVRLRLVGAGPDSVSLANTAARLLAPEIVVFEGAVNQDRIRDLYGAADTFCIPSFAEGIPVVLMEAMAMEIPCVTTHITGIPELIRDKVDGLLVAASDLDGLARAIASLMDDPALRVRLGQKGRERVLADYDLLRNVGQLADIFRDRLPVTSP